MEEWTAGRTKTIHGECRLTSEGTRSLDTKEKTPGELIRDTSTDVGSASPDLPATGTSLVSRTYDRTLSTAAGKGVVHRTTRGHCSDRTGYHTLHTPEEVCPTPTPLLRKTVKGTRSTRPPLRTTPGGSGTSDVAGLAVDTLGLTPSNTTPGSSPSRKGHSDAGTAEGVPIGP